MYSKPLSLSETAKALQSGKLNVIEFISDVCNRIEMVNPVIQALLPEPDRKQRMLREAQELLEKYPYPELRPPFFGIPIGVKDLFCVDGFATLAGSKLPPEEFAFGESFVVAQLKVAGAIIAGKTVTTEFAYFEPGPTRNPWQIEHTPGGSSSGSAAAVAAGLVPFALGTQTIGSVIRPAAFCGVVGFKPTQGSIPLDGIIPFSPQSDHVGFFCNDLDGVMLAHSILQNKKITNSIECIDDLKVGVVIGKYLMQSDDESRLLFYKALEKWNNADISISEIDFLEDIDLINALHRTIIAYDFARVHHAWYAKFKNLYSVHSQNLYLEGMAITDGKYQDALHQREKLRCYFQSKFQDGHYHALVSPSATSLAPKGLSFTGSPLMNLPWTFLGWPAISLPVFDQHQALPFGLQVVANLHEDESLLNISKQILTAVLPS